LISKSRGLICRLSPEFGICASLSEWRIWRIWGLNLCGLAPMKQASGFEPLVFNPAALKQVGLPSTDLDISTG